jgi:hypothetical protein
MRILIGCEESQAVTIEFRKLGFEAFSCDIQECSGGHPEWHFKQDIFEVIKGGQWGMMIAFPPCTFLTVTANKWMKPEFKERFPTRQQDREEAIDFFMKLYNCGIKKVALENPIGVMSTHFKQPDQIINPFYFGDPTPKSTCLWLKNLPKLVHSRNGDLFTEKTHVEPEYIIGKRDRKKYSKIHYQTVTKEKGERARIRSKTFPGIAKAMATQWSEYILNK